MVATRVEDCQGAEGEGSAKDVKDIRDIRALRLPQVVSTEEEVCFVLIG